MYQYSPVYSQRGPVGRMGQNGGAPAAPAAPAPTTVAVVPAGYTGVPGFLETVTVLGVSAAAAYTGIKAGMNKSNNKTNRAAGWAGGIGAALLGLLYLGGKANLTQQAGLPSVKVVA